MPVTVASEALTPARVRRDSGSVTFLRWLRRHAAFLVALSLGAVLRVVVSLAYVPALIFPDTRGYLANALPFQVHDMRPSGYSLFLLPFRLFTDNLAPIEAVQHVMGLGLAVACYAFMLRRRLPPWAATLVVLPLLFDPLQLVLEAYVLSDVLFETLLVGACLLVLWRRRPGAGALVVAGAMVGCSAFVRGAGTFLLVVFVVALLCLRVHWVKLVAFVLAAVIPMAAYAVDYHATYGQYSLTTAGPRFLYGRLAPAVDCHDPQLHLPSYEQRLCPHRRIGHRPNSGWFMWKHRHSPQYHVKAPAGMTDLQVIKDFDKRVLRAEPLMYAGLVVPDFLRGFNPTRTNPVPAHPATYWLFNDHYWTVDLFIKRGLLSKHIRDGTGYRPRLADFLTTYRQWVYTPGPLMAALLLLAVAALLGLGRARRSGDRVAAGLLAATCVLPLLTAAALSGFSWRYQLPQVALLPMAGALGLRAVLLGRHRDAPQPAPPLRVLDRSAAFVARLASPSSTGRRVPRAVGGGTLQWLLGIVYGAVVGCAVGLAAVASGWASRSVAAATGLVVGAFVSVVLLVARIHAGPAEMDAHPEVGRRDALYS